jgi:uncharacterized protein YllA (UPF0747 family)
MYKKNHTHLRLWSCERRSLKPKLPEKIQHMETKALMQNHGELKKKILDAAIKKHQSVVDDFALTIKEMLASQGIVNEDEMDLSQQAYNTEMFQKSIQIGDRLAFANEELKLLFDMTSTIGSIHNNVQLGSVVVTDRDIFFVSASIEEFEVDGLKIFGLSIESPLFKSMEGKKKGDRFGYNYGEYRIFDTF